MQIRLSEGAESAGAQPQLTPANAARLSDQQAESILKRLEPIKQGADDEKDFQVRDRSLPAPRTGKTVTSAFPPAESSQAPDNAPSGPLEVLRYSPEGDVPLAPHLSMTFSQPMVAITSHADATAANLPVRLTPEPEGRWRWVGTKTLLFEPAGRFPMATDYRVEVPAATKSATGAALASPKRWSFKTPPPTVQSSYPNGGPFRRDPLFFVEFDQAIDPAAVLKTVRVRAASREWPTRLATGEEVAADMEVSRMASAAERGRWLAFRVVDSRDSNSVGELPADASVSVTIGPGTPSAEGPLRTTEPASFSFKTFGPLRVVRHECGYNFSCSPFDQWSVQFTNSLDAQTFDQSQVRVEPEIAGMKTAIYGETLIISGVKKGRTTYRLTLDRAIRDVFGQSLGESVSLVFNVKSAPAALNSSGDHFVVLDPAAPPRLSVFSINHASLKARIYRVGPENWNQFLAFMRSNVQNAERTPPGRLVSSTTIAVEAQADEMAETRIDLAPALEGGFGHAFVIVEPAVQPPNRNERRQVIAWVQVTAIGLDAFVDGSELIGWATSLKDGRPIDGVQMTIAAAQSAGLRQGTSGVTHADGLAHIALPANEPAGQNILVARKGNDVAILPENPYWWNDRGGWYRREAVDSLRWYVFDDRKMYRPGEEVHIKGWIRLIGGGKEGDVRPLAGAASSVAYLLRDSRGNEILKGSAPLNALGGFDTSFKLPPTMNLGGAYLEFSAVGAAGVIAQQQQGHSIQVQEFRRPEFEVTAQSSEGPHFVGSSADATVTASYYAGGGLANASVAWQVVSTPAYFTPPNRGDFTFGKWAPWWIPYNEYREGRREVFAGRTDASGKHRLRMDFVSVDPPRPMTVTAEASVMDVNRQAWNATTTLLVHPADLYVGIRSPRTFVQKGEPLTVQAIVTDLDGKAIVGREIRVRAVLMDWVFERGEWRQKEVNPQECVIKSAADAVECKFETKEGGAYKVTATIYDDRERRNESELTLWVAGGKTVPKRNVEQEDAGLIPDRKEYQPGDTAEILVQAPFYPAEGVMTLRRSGILATERFKMEGPSHTLRVPIKEFYTPNLYVQVDLVGAAARTDDSGNVNASLPKRPAFASGSLNLIIPPHSRRLTVQATPRDKALEPGGETTVAVEVRDSAGRAVSGSEVAVVVVDEAILGLTGYRLGDPMATFYSHRGPETSDFHLRRDVLLSNPEFLLSGGGGGGGVDNLAMLAPGVVAAPAPMAEAGTAARQRSNAFALKEESAAPIQLRENFNALATFAPAVPTDSDGRAIVKVKLPDNLTRYRVMAVAVANGRQFGLNESAITARLPLMVRPSPPRFLNFGDKFELPVVVQNQTDLPMEVNVAVRATNAEITEGAGRRVTVPANDRVEVRFPTSAVRAGMARFQIAATSGEWADAAEVSLPVWTPATTEAFAVYGEVDQGAIVQPVSAPSDAVKQFGGLEITTSSTQLQALTDAVLYLVAYPFECAEQLSSRVLAVAALRDVLVAFEAKGLPNPEELVAAVERDIKRLQSLQNEDGGFGFWRRDDESWPYVSIHVAHALVRAREKGLEVPSVMLDRSKAYLVNIESHIPGYYSLEARRALIAYALYVRNRMGHKDAARARQLIAEAGLDKLSLETVGWLLAVLAGDAGSQAELAAIRRHLNNRATETAATAHFVTNYSDGEHLLLHSSRRADGVILEALIQDQPSSDLIPKVVRGLLAHRKAGRWENTQENAFVLLALDKYFAVYEKATPDFVARAWLGDAYAGGHEFRGRTTERHHVNVPMRYLADRQGAQNLILSKEGPGRMYYRVGMQYAPASLRLAPSDHGFTVERVYEAVDKADDVRRDADGAWRIKAGAKVRVKLTMIAQSRRYHVALVDPMPAGLEALNPALAVTGSIPQDPNDLTKEPWWWWRRPWFEHQNMRDERVEAFTSLLWEGVYTYSYVARATTPGAFVVPPAKAEEMYHPETFGRTATDRVVVE
ncbi:MAG TPA: alpha-2-macroglobulin family protein [Blastocatellia bacterium]|nr:alpha-2-macroglobulin family protein [Blastocatellia bacterium]